jgi:hypothetical protein
VTGAGDAGAFGPFTTGTRVGPGTNPVPLFLEFHHGAGENMLATTNLLYTFF